MNSRKRRTLPWPNFESDEIVRVSCCVTRAMNSRWPPLSKNPRGEWKVRDVRAYRTNEPGLEALPARSEALAQRFPLSLPDKTTRAS